MAEVSCPAGTIGLVVPFILIDPLVSGGTATPISNAISATSVTWLAQNGLRRQLTLSQSVSATFTYVFSAGDTRSPHIEEGVLEVAFGTNRFYSTTFDVNIFPYF